MAKYGGRKPNEFLSNAEWLENEYSSHSAADIARQLEVNPCSVRYWLDKHGIPRKDPKQAVAEANRSRKGVWQYPHSLKGHHNHNWKGGITEEDTKFRNSAEYIDWRNNVLERDSHKCVECNRKYKSSWLHAHHIKSFKDFPELRLDISNGITLCRNCHIKVHGRDFGNAPRCRNCSKPVSRHGVLCKSCSNVARHGNTIKELKSSRPKRGKCIDCGIPVYQNSKRCGSCEQQRRANLK